MVYLSCLIMIFRNYASGHTDLKTNPFEEKSLMQSKSLNHRPKLIKFIIHLLVEDYVKLIF